MAATGSLECTRWLRRPLDFPDEAAIITEAGKPLDYGDFHEPTAVEGMEFV